MSESQLEDYTQRAQNACLQISTIANDLKEKLEGTTNEQLLFGVEKFVSRYSKLKNSVPLLTSSLHHFGWTFGGTITSNKGGHWRYGRRIAVQATAAGRRKGKSRGKSRATPGKIVKTATVSIKESNTSRYHLPTRKLPKRRRPHSLKTSIDKGHQNAGKW